jgi:hypothetical protein
MGIALALIALFVSAISLILSISFWSRSFRPIVTAAVRTHTAGNVATVYNLVLLNSGTLPARKVRIRPSGAIPAEAFGLGATEEDKQLWLAAFEDEGTVEVLHNGSKVSCGFGMTKADDKGFWRYEARIPVVITYRGWFEGWWEWLVGGEYREEQDLQIVDSGSFAGGMWAGRSES